MLHVQADLQSAGIEYQDLQSDYWLFAWLSFRSLGVNRNSVFFGRGSHRLPIICRHSVTLPAGVGVSAAAIGHDPP